mgnify:CR=1 FL=1
MSDVYEKYREEYFAYLEDLRKSGVTNMFGAAPYLQEMFDLTEKTSKQVLSEWMRSYEKK